MEGRADVVNPEIINGAESSVIDMDQDVRTNLRLLRDFYGERGIILMRKHLARYFHGFRHAARLRGELVRAASFEEAVSLIDRYEGGGFEIPED